MDMLMDVPSFCVLATKTRYAHSLGALAPRVRRRSLMHHLCMPVRCVLAELEEVSSDAIGAGGWLRDLEGRKRLPSTCMSRNIADV